MAGRGLEPVYIIDNGDTLAHALNATAPGETGRLAGHSRPAGTQELRDGLADALAADLRLPPGERRLWPALTGQTAPGGTARPLASDGSEDEAVRAVRTGSDGSDWLTLAVAAPVLNLNLTVLTPDGASWAAGPEDGRPAVLFQQQDPPPFTAEWAATQPPAEARPVQPAPPVRETPARVRAQAPAPASAPAEESSMVPRALGTPAPASTPAQPEVFFGADPRPTAPAPQRTPLGSKPKSSTTSSSSKPKEAPSSSKAKETSSKGTTSKVTSSKAASSQKAPSTPVAETTAPTPVRESRQTPQHRRITAMVPADPGEGSSRSAAANSGSGHGSGHGGEGEGSAPRALSRYALEYGSRHDGMVGLVLYEAQTPENLDGLYQQVLDELGVAPGSAAAADVRAQLTEALGVSEISQHLPSVRSGRGHRVTVTVDGAERTVDVRMRQTDPRLNQRAGTAGEVPHKTKVERTGDGGQASSSSQDSGTVRTVPIPWIGIYEGPQGPLRWFDGTLTASVTHNQLSQSVTVSEGLSTKTVQRAGDEAHAVDYTSQWQGGGG
ncbi:hypothetical protein ADK38_25465, partial [Streptomyces varsoviensis]